MDSESIANTLRIGELVDDTREAGKSLSVTMDTRRANMTT